MRNDNHPGGVIHLPEVRPGQIAGLGPSLDLLADCANGRLVPAHGGQEISMVKWAQDQVMNG